MTIAFSRFFQREKVPDRADEGEVQFMMVPAACGFPKP